MNLISTVAVDLAMHPDVSWAVIFNGQLLSMRFGSEGEASQHLHDMQNNTFEDKHFPSQVPSIGRHGVNTKNVARSDK